VIQHVEQIIYNTLVRIISLCNIKLLCWNFCWSSMSQSDICKNFRAIFRSNILQHDVMTK